MGKNAVYGEIVRTAQTVLNSTKESMSMKYLCKTFIEPVDEWNRAGVADGDVVWANTNE